MAFTPEDVLNKHFTATQFRRGYDEQEVDDFLDEIVVELRRLTADNDDLGVQLKACQESKSVAVPRGAMVSAAAVGAGSRAESTASFGASPGAPPGIPATAIAYRPSGSTARTARSNCARLRPVICAM